MRGQTHIKFSGNVYNIQQYTAIVPHPESDRSNKIFLQLNVLAVLRIRWLVDDVSQRTVEFDSKQIWVGQSSTRTGFTPKTSSVHCLNHCTALYTIEFLQLSVFSVRYFKTYQSVICNTNVTISCMSGTTEWPLSVRFPLHKFGKIFHLSHSCYMPQ